MARETTIDSRQEILRTAARLFQQRGYDATSMNDVAAALRPGGGGRVRMDPAPNVRTVSPYAPGVVGQMKVLQFAKNVRESSLIIWVAE